MWSLMQTRKTIIEQQQNQANQIEKKKTQKTMETYCFNDLWAKINEKAEIDINFKIFF